MKRILLPTLVILLPFVSLGYAGLLDDAKKLTEKVKQSSSGEPDTSTVIAGLKEALSVGTENAVKTVSVVNGYFGNPAIKIPLPEKAHTAAKVLKKIGMQKQVDEFTLSMNRAAEKASPQAKKIFLNAVKQMTFQDARKILHGSDTTATDYLKSKTSAQLTTAFKPIVASAMNDVGVTRYYTQMMDKAKATHLVKPEDADLDHYVTGKALDGLFYMVGLEEKKIRKDPAARVTELLKKVFKKQ